MLKRVMRKIWILVTLLIIPALLYILRYSSGTSDTTTSAFDLHFHGRSRLSTYSGEL